MRIYTIVDDSGSTQVQSDTVEIQSMSADGSSILYRFVGDAADAQATVAFYPGTNKTKITSIQG